MPSNLWETKCDYPIYYDVEINLNGERRHKPSLLLSVPKVLPMRKCYMCFFVKFFLWCSGVLGMWGCKGKELPGC